MELEQARRFALSLTEAVEEPHFERTSFRVAGRIFATAAPAGESLNVFVGEHEVRAAVAEAPEAFAELWWGGRLRGVRVTLAAAPEARVRELLEEAWALRAPRRLREPS